MNSLKVCATSPGLTQTMVQGLMGNKPEERFAFIQDRAELAGEELIDVWRRPALK